MRKTIIMLLLIGMVATVTGCATWHGAGKDVEGVGRAMQP